MQKKNFLNEVLFVGVLIIGVLIVRKVLAPCIITGESMAPTLLDKEIVFAKQDFKDTDLNYNTIIIFKNGETQRKTYVKRIVGLPGDTVLIKEGLLYINGKIYEDVSPRDLMTDAGIANKEIVIPYGEYFVLGDNRNNSRDSRHIGTVNFEDIAGIIKEQ